MIIDEKLDDVFSLYMSSEFEEKYRGKYESDCILKEIFNHSIRKRPFRKPKNPHPHETMYEYIISRNAEVMTDFIELFLNEANANGNAVSDVLAFRMTCSFYIDPDPYSIKMFDDIACTADGLISINRIHRRLGVTPEFIKEYKACRKHPVVFFPKERNGINVARCRVFGDRIDHALFDLKNYYAGKDFRLGSAYAQKKTANWLNVMGSFENIVDEFKLKGVFTNDAYEVLDLDKSDGSIITEYDPLYRYEWTSCYYENLRSILLSLFEGYTTPFVSK